MIEMKVWWAKIYYMLSKDTEHYTREDGLFRPDDHKDKYSSYFQIDKSRAIQLIEMRKINHDIEFIKDII